MSKEADMKEIYDKAVALSGSSKESDQLEAAKLFDSIRSYRDSAYKADECRYTVSKAKIIAEDKRLADSRCKEWERAKRGRARTIGRRKKLFFQIILALGVIVAVAYGSVTKLTRVMEKNKDETVKQIINEPLAYNHRDNNLRNLPEKLITIITEGQGSKQDGEMNPESAEVCSDTFYIPEGSEAQTFNSGQVEKNPLEGQEMTPASSVSNTNSLQTSKNQASSNYTTNYYAPSDSPSEELDRSMEVVLDAMSQPINIKKNSSTDIDGHHRPELTYTEEARNQEPTYVEEARDPEQTYAEEARDPEQTYAEEAGNPDPTYAEEAGDPDPTYAEEARDPEQMYAEEAENSDPTYAEEVGDPDPTYAEEARDPDPTYAEEAGDPDPTYAEEAGNPEQTYVEEVAVID